MVGFDRYAHILLISIPTYGISPLFTSVWRWIANSGYLAIGSPGSPKFRAAFMYGDIRLFLFYLVNDQINNCYVLFIHVCNSVFYNEFRFKFEIFMKYINEVS